MSWNIQTPGDYINGPLTVVGAATLNSTLTVSGVSQFNSNIGIGGTPSGSFRVHAFGSSSGVLINKNAANQLLAVSMKNSTQDYCLFVDQDGIASNSWSVFDNTNLHTAQRYYPGAAGYWQFLVNGVERLRLNNTGSLLLNGGTTADGVGIAFPSTQVASSNANTLDDYEEGTWTGTLKGSVSDPTTPVTVSGRYTKIGRSVTIDIYFSNVNTTGASGPVFIAGLPFSVADRPNGTVSIFSFDMNGGSSLYADFSSTFIYINASRTNGSWVDVLHSAGTNRYLRVTGTYTV